MGKIKTKNENPFGIRKAPVEIISAQAVTLDDYVSNILSLGKCRPVEDGPCLSGQNS